MLPFNVVVHDTECYPNIWTYGDINPITGQRMLFEISERVNQIDQFRDYIRHLKFHKFRMVGYNSIGYDYPIIHAIMTDMSIQCAADIFVVSKRIIDTQWNDRFKNRIPQYQWIVQQIDLFMVHHFDNQAKSTSLKMLEFVMRLTNISDLPFKPETVLTFDEMQVLIDYQDDDIDATAAFFTESIPALEFRHTLSEQHGKDFMNMNDGKIGETYFIMGLEKAGVKTHDGREKRQTWRDHIDLGEVIFPYVKFENPEFNRVLNEIRGTRIYETKGSQKWTATIDGFDYDLGLGGIHGSIEGQIVHSDDEYVVTDLDFASWYPHLSFKNNVYPEHLSPEFCKIYQGLYLERKKHAKGTLLNGLYKLSLNVPYGQSNSVYSCFYDPKFTMTITINGQLILCMLAEQLLKIPNLTMIQVNTDGLTVRYPRKYESQLKAIWQWIEQVTGIELNGVDYDTMAIRDVNNYLAKYAGSDKIKYNGAYSFNPDWHQNHSALVIRKAACEAILNGKNVREYIMNHADIFDFFLCTKVPRSGSLVLQAPVMWGDKMVLPAVTTDVMQNITRYYVSNAGHKLVKRMSPLKRKKGCNIEMTLIGWERGCGLNKNLKIKTENEYNSAIVLGYRIKNGGDFNYSDVREFGVDKDWLVTPVNNITDDMTYDINYEYYITEADKLVNKVL